MSGGHENKGLMMRGMSEPEAIGNPADDGSAGGKHLWREGVLAMCRFGFEGGRHGAPSVVL